MRARGVLVAVTDHAVERFRQRVGGRTGEFDPRPEIVARVARAWEAGRVSEEAPAAAPPARGTVYVRDLVDRELVFVCRHDRAAQELVVVTLWEPRALGDAARAPAVHRRTSRAPAAVGPLTSSR